MNYYEHHLGDYAEATAHLSFVEDGAYSRLIRKCYSTEAPLPADTKAVIRLVGARTKEERQAVLDVLEEFFELQEDGWHNHRCDVEIARYRESAPERELKKANENNRLRRHREQRSRLFEILTEAGDHAAWNIPMEELRARVAALRATEPATPQQPLPATAPATPATATQTPDTKHQTPSLSPSLRSGGARKRAPHPSKPVKTLIPEGFAVSEAVKAWAQKKGFDRLEEHLQAFVHKCKAHGYTYTDWDSAFMEAIREDWAKLRGRTANGAPPPGDIAAWDRDSGTIRKKGIELGLGDWDREAFEHGDPGAVPFKAYENLVRAKIDELEAQPA